MSDLVRSIDRLLLLLGESGGYHADRRYTQAASEAAEAMKSAEAALLVLRRRVAIGADAPTFAFVGNNNAGKSTLLNALLGRHVLPTGIRPLTALPIEVRNGPQPALGYVSTGGVARRTMQSFKSEAALIERIAEIFDLETGRPTIEARRVVIELADDPLLATGLTLVDTPGFNVVQAGESSGTHEASLRSFLDEAADDLQVVWVVSARQSVTAAEKRFFLTALDGECAELVFTRADGASESARRHLAEQVYANVFGVPVEEGASRCPPIHFVSGALGLRARQQANGGDYEVSGVSGLEKSLRAYADPKEREACVSQPLLRLAGDLRSALEGLRGPRGRFEGWWRPDSFDRFVERRADERAPLPLQAQLVRILTEPRTAIVGSGRANPGARGGRP